MRHSGWAKYLERSFNVGIRNALLIYITLPVAILYGLFTWIGGEITQSWIHDRLKEDLALVGRSIKLPVAEALSLNNTEALQANLDSAFSIGRIYGASVFDTSGELVAVAGVTEMDLQESKTAAQVVQTGEQRAGYRSVEGRKLFSHFIPVKDRKGEVLGLLQVTRQASDFSDTLFEVNIIALASWALLVLLTIAILFVSHHYVVGRHLGNILASMQRVTSGQKEHRTSVTGPVELRKVAKRLNDMLDSITEAEQAIITHREREETLRMQLKEQETIAAIGHVAQGVAHELGAPLMVIDSRAKRLEPRVSDEDKTQLEAIRGQVSRLSDLVHQLMQFAKTPIAEKQPTKVSELISKAIEGVSFEMGDEAKRIHVQSIIPPITLNIDRDRIELALVNILRNGIQASRHQVIVECETSHHQVYISVTDDGAGLPKDRQWDSLVSPFVSTRKPGKGYGLGLTIVSHIVRQHGGYLNLENSEQGGCTASMVLPKN